MKSHTRLAESLTVADLEANPVWRFINVDAAGQTRVSPVKRLPVRTLAGKLIGTQVRLANGKLVWGLVGNVEPFERRLTQHFVAISIEAGGEWFHLARYHDVDYEVRGPRALALFLGLEVDEVFPLSYDLTEYGPGDPAVLSGQIHREPPERLSRSELIALAIP